MASRANGTGDFMEHENTERDQSPMVRFTAEKEGETPPGTGSQRSAASAEKFTHLSFNSFLLHHDSVTAEFVAKSLTK